MSKLLKKLKQKKALMKIDNILIKKDTFSKIEEIDGKKVYYTKIFKHLIDFKITNKEQRLRLVFQEFNNNNKNYYFFNLFSLEKK